MNQRFVICYAEKTDDYQYIEKVLSQYNRNSIYSYYNIEAFINDELDLNENDVIGLIVE